MIDILQSHHNLAPGCWIQSPLSASINSFVPLTLGEVDGDIVVVVGPQVRVEVEQGYVVALKQTCFSINILNFNA